jgi:alkaline phosphatase D
MRRSLSLLIALTLALAACKSSGDLTYKHGVAAGDVTSTSAVLWTRAEGVGGPPEVIRREERTFTRWRDVLVTADVSSNQSFQSGVLSFEGMTSGDEDFTVQVEATGLTPDTRYYYRFRAGGAVSEVGTFVTAPSDATSNPLRFIFSGDSDGTHDRHGDPVYGDFGVLDTAAAEDPAFFLYLGDTIYADHGGIRDETPRARGAKYRQNREYDALRNLLQQTSVVAMWDDHEIYDDFSGDFVQSWGDDPRGTFRSYFPLDLPEQLSFFDAMHRSLRWGKDVELIVLDTRSARDLSAARQCSKDPLPAGALPDAPDTLRGVRSIAELPVVLPEGCDRVLLEPRTMLGEQQKEFLFDRLQNSDATWKIVATSVPMQALLFAPYDRWEGYPAERREVLEFIRDNGIKNVVFLSTDLHANIFGPVRIDPFVETAPLAYEAIAGPIAAETLEEDIVNVLGEGGAGLLSAFLTGIVGVDCAQLNSFAYGLVEINGGTLTITAKDADGSVLCAKTLEAE